jgi:hypothetical protein
LEDAFVFPDPTNGATLVALFSGLDLQPGTYFLTLAAFGTIGGGWSDSLNGDPDAAIILGTGVTLGPFTFASPANVNPSDPPESTFIPVDPSADQVFFEVTGNPVPEPSSFVLVGGAIAVLFAWRRRARGLTLSKRDRRGSENSGRRATFS